MGNSDKSGTARRINAAVGFAKKIGMMKKRINRRMEGKYSPSLIAMAAAAVSSVLMLCMLFIPNYLGVADDGSVSEVMNSAGVYYIKDEIADNYNNYFVRTYSSVLSGYEQKGGMQNSQVYLVKAAVWLDNVVTQDKYFDIRFLALLYVILYVPAIYLLIRQVCMRVKTFSEGTAIGVLGVVMFADVAYITYFNSFYPEALWLISLMYCVAAAVSFQESVSGWRDFGFLTLYTVSGLVLTFSRKQCALLGILLALYCMKLLFCRRDWRWGVLCVLAGAVLSAASIACLVRLESDFNRTSKFHAMTRGVLFSSDDPAEALGEFGIDPSYELLTDASSFDYLPLVNAEDEVVEENFLDKYTTLDIGMYYVRHPGKFLRMADAAIKSCFGIRRDYCGNYEQSAGMPPMAKSIFWSMWSTFKNNSMPRTIGFLIVLTGVSLLLFGRGYSLRPRDDRRNTVFLDTMLVLTCICLEQAGVTVISSGDVEMIQHCFLISVSIDLMIYFVFAELVHRIKIF